MNWLLDVMTTSSGRKPRLTDHILRQAQSRFKLGETLSEIAKTLGVTQSGLSKALKRRAIDLPRREPALSIHLLNKAKSLYESGLSQERVANHLGIKRTTLAKYLRESDYKSRNRYDVLRSKRKIREELALSLHYQYHSGHRINDLARDLGFSRTAILQAFSRFNFTVAQPLRFSPEMIHSCCRELELGVTLRHLAETGDFSISGFRQAAKRFGITPPKRRSAQDQHPIKAAKRKALADDEIRRIHKRRVTERIGISTLASEYGISASVIYSRFKRLNLKVSRSMGTAKKTISEELVRDIYEEAFRLRKSVSQIIRDRSLYSQRGGITIFSRKIGLKPPSPREITGHADRRTYMYTLRVEHPDGRVGLYGGQSIDPQIRRVQHIRTATLSRTKKNKRDAFMRDAIRWIEKLSLSIDDHIVLQVDRGGVSARNAASAETAHIEPIKANCLEHGYEFLNGLIGAPAGGYGRKVHTETEAEIIREYLDGTSTELLAVQFGVGRSTVNRIIQRTGNQKPRSVYLKRVSDDAVLQLRQSGMTLSGIAKKLGISTSTVSVVLRKWKLTNAKRGIP